MKAIIEKSVRFIDANENFADLITTTRLFGIPIKRSSIRIAAPYENSYTLDEREVKSYYVSQILLEAIRYRR